MKRSNYNTNIWNGIRVCFKQLDTILYVVFWIRDKVINTSNEIVSQYEYRVRVCSEHKTENKRIKWVVYKRLKDEKM